VSAQGSPYSSGAFKRLERTRRSKSDWSEQHYGALLAGFGFVRRPASKHNFYAHADYPDVYVVVPRGRRLRCYVADAAIAAIEEILSRKGISRGD
jgi:hypothetical protein